MLFVVFKPLDVRKDASFPPFIIKIDEALLNLKVLEIKRKVHTYFQSYVSPFITEQNLRLTNK